MNQMNRFEQRLKQRMRNPEFAAGYREMDAELELIAALEQAREALHLSKEELAQRMGRKRESISRLLNAEQANPTLETITEILSALGIVADIRLRRAMNDEHPIHIEMALE
jgi:transcriptional regulator with XRE-family HTH domain